VPSEVGGAARDDEASVLCAGRPYITWPSSLTQAPPPGARGLVRVGSPTGPIQAPGRRRPGSPPSPPDCR
jgi:hypothetical protein